MNWHVLDPNPQGEPAVLLLHGLGANAESWGYQLQALAEAGLRPLALDLPGFGRTRYDGGDWTLPRMASLLAAWMDEQGLDRVCAAGISMGGVVAQQLALDFPQRVEKLALINTFAVLRPERLEGWLYFLGRFATVHLLGLEKQAQLVARRIFPGEDQRAQYEDLVRTIASSDPRAYRAAMRALGLYDARRRLPQLRIPTLVLTGTADTTVSPARQKELAALIPGARQVLIPDAGHGMIVEAPAACNRALLDFLLEEEG